MTQSAASSDHRAVPSRRDILSGLDSIYDELDDCDLTGPVEAVPDEKQHPLPLPPPLPRSIPARQAAAAFSSSAAATRPKR